MTNFDERQFALLKDKIYELSHIHIVDSKQAMIKNRVAKLAKDMDYDSIDELLKAVDKDKKIAQEFINVFTTNKTDFFREAFHFEDLLDRVLPNLLRGNRTIKIFCCASSTGQEPYSIACTALYAKKLYPSSTRIEITATDIDTQVLKIAQEGKYEVNPAQEQWPKWAEDEMHEFFSVVDENPRLRYLSAKPKLKNLITFRQLNLFNKVYPFNAEEFDVIFCRNVLIYFTKNDQMQILRRLFGLLKVGGTLYLGHSEGLHDLVVDTEKLGRKIFIKK
ncbi:chemotaxis protein [Helicobacter sp. MIT 00-7814]|uniref:CheR family methyltransferase n=1 Tax=unclassified Helicobacter TaxID=2593540 RepID=UPI000E1E60D7|nr:MULTISPECIES: protein-glutamate O-methyltransferase CheR [unclassified Helicobacter]RDU55295.1 chemotaxis protein [Helicobacter sp. MIT 99-10781]RDU56133.1 chemotaxis protein [Helicobacter sp. MIT 00-7814]